MKSKLAGHTAKAEHQLPNQSGRCVTPTRRLASLPTQEEVQDPNEHQIPNTAMPPPIHEHCRKMATKDGQQSPWYNAFPEPQAKPGTIEPSEVAALLEQHTDTPRDFLLVDVRRTDFEGGTVTSSINLPAQSLYPTRKQVYGLAKQAGTKKLIFYCGEHIPACNSEFEPSLTDAGSSNGRGPRCAAWMQDFINETGDTDIESLVLNGGIRGWVKEYGGRMTDGYDAKVWESSIEAK